MLQVILIPRFHNRPFLGALRRQNHYCCKYLRKLPLLLRDPTLYHELLISKTTAVVRVNEKSHILPATRTFNQLLEFGLSPHAQYTQKIL